MAKIPTHKSSEQFQGEMAMFRYVSEDDEQPPIDYAHKDDYYMFFFIEKGQGKLLLDFKEYEVTDNCLLCVLPGQIHFPVDYVNARGWILAVDSLLVKEEYKEIFEKISFMDTRVELKEDFIRELSVCASIIQKRFIPERGQVQENILHSLISYYIGLIAELFEKGFPILLNKRPAMITARFKVLLAANYKSWKRPARYASELNISPVYLNEIVKKVTGLTVSEWVQQEIIIQAKRLLYYTDLSVKEIALELGYQDWAYFTRLFTKSVALSPTQFRKKYLK